MTLSVQPPRAPCRLFLQQDHYWSAERGLEHQNNRWEPQTSMLFQGACGAAGASPSCQNPRRMSLIFVASLCRMDTRIHPARLLPLIATLIARRVYRAPAHRSAIPLTSGPWAAVRVSNFRVVFLSDSLACSDCVDYVPRVACCPPSLNLLNAGRGDAPLCASVLPVRVSLRLSGIAVSVRQGAEFSVVTGLGVVRVLPLHPSPCLRPAPVGQYNFSQTIRRQGSVVETLIDGHIILALLSERTPADLKKGFRPII